MIERGVDDPIRSAPEDLLGRLPFACALARQVVAAPDSASTVVGIYGVWGDGKTSVLNLMNEQLQAANEPPIVIWFNPWLVEDAGQLVERFLYEMAAELTKQGRLDERAAKKLETGVARYAGLLLGRRGEELKRIMTEGTVHDARDEVRNALREGSRRVVVCIDDIDRLTPGEVREVLRLVKLVADFPMTTYVLAFDRARIERALGEAAGPGLDARAKEGREYLEKIVQVVADVPTVSTARLLSAFDAELEEVLRRSGREVPRGPRWKAMRQHVIAANLRTLRDVRRYLAGIPITLELVGDEIDLGDVLALEALRIFAPDLSQFLLEHAARLTRGLYGLDQKSDARATAELEALVDGAPRRDLLRRAIMHMLPAAEWTLAGSARMSEEIAAWRRERRVAVLGNLLFYFAKTQDGDRLSNVQLAAILDALGNANSLDDLLSPLDEAMLGSLLARLRDYADDLRPTDAAENLAAFSRLAGRLAASDLNNMGFDAEGQLVALLAKLVGQLPVAEHDAIYRRLAGHPTASITLRWLLLVHARADGSNRLPPMSNATREELRVPFEQDLMQLDAATLTVEPHLRELLDVFATRPDGGAHLSGLAEDDALLLAALRIWTVMTYEDQHQLSLPWDELVAVFGREWLERRACELLQRGHGRRRPPEPVDVLRHYVTEDRPLPLSA